VLICAAEVRKATFLKGKADIVFYFCLRGRCRIGAEMRSTLAGAGANPGRGFAPAWFWCLGVGKVPDIICGSQAPTLFPMRLELHSKGVMNLFPAYRK
jgi:hypothetical protein